jgi:hypothetical protein
MAKPVITATLRWETRQAAEQDCLRILRRSGYRAGDTVTDPAHVAVLDAILSIHPHVASKTGSGVRHYEVRPLAGTAGTEVSSDSISFWIIRTDGSAEDFSYIEAIYPSDQKKNVTNALRASINDLRIAFRDSRFASGSTTSDVSGATFPNRASATVIYESPSFAQLAFRFAESEGGWDEVSVQAGGAGPFVGEALTDSGQLARWREFFRAHARPMLATRSEGARRPKTDEAAWKP